MTPSYHRISYELLGKVLCPDADRSNVWGGIHPSLLRLLDAQCSGSH